MSTNSSPDPRPSFEEAVSHPAYDSAASAISKTYIFLFYIFCGIVAYLDRPNLGLWWLVVLVGGLFGSSLFFAAPITAFKVFLGTKVGISPLKTYGWLLYKGIDFAGYVALWFATRYVINILSNNNI